MITSIHTLIYSDDANATRAFLRDVLGWKYVAEDFDNDWLIFKSGPSELGVHPTHSEWGWSCPARMTFSCISRRTSWRTISSAKQLYNAFSVRKRNGFGYPG
jgi:hypothetical protein